jgi:hypothetical protein
MDLVGKSLEVDKTQWPYSPDVATPANAWRDIARKAAAVPPAAVEAPIVQKTMLSGAISPIDGTALLPQTDDAQRDRCTFAFDITTVW